MIKRFYILLLAIVASVGMSWATTTDLASITDNYTAQDGEILTGTLGVNVKISIADGATVTLLNANINGDKTWTSGDYAGLTCLGDATITIVGKNSVSGFSTENGYPGIYVPSGKTLIIKGTGSLTAQSSTEEAAGIGAGRNTHCGNIEIQSGKITAIAGGEEGAGIGGGFNADCGNITISGGIVTAVGGDYSAGIGGGRRSGGTTDAGHCGNILISGGVVSATSGKQAAAIGGGRGNNNAYKSNCGTITITNTALKVYAEQGGEKGSTNTIGAAKYGNCGAVTIGGNTGVINDDPYTYRTKEDGEIVVDYINAIGTVVYTQECKDKIDIARELYDALEDSQKTLVTNYQTLLDAEAAYAALIPAAPANPCGDGVIWELNDGEMTISYTGTGTGAMENYSYYTKTPWYDSRKSITSIIIQDGVTTIGNYSFMDLENLQSVVIGNDVVTIGSHAFEQCGSSFTSLTLGNSIVEIGEQAFINNSRITSINFPSTLQTIGEDAFYGCTKISSLTIPSSVTSIGDYAFGGCSLIAYIIAQPTTPPSTEENTFISIVTPSYIPLYVPNGSVAAYTAADRWNTFNIQGYDPSTGPTIEPVPATPDQLSGAFTINGDGDQINFSKGNLQYVGSWRFAENQWNIIGNDQADNNRDLFGWGTGDAPNKVSTTLADYAVYHEWGTNMGDGWYTLSRDEWTYLFQSRTNAANLYAPARVNGVSGFVILPDEFTLPSGLSFTAGVTNYGTNFYANAAWRAMENAGAVFLPVDGYRYDGNKIKWVGQSGFYWSSTVASEGASAWSWLISASDGARRDYYNLHYGMCVRLVKAVVLTPDDVMALINAIGTVEYTAESKKKIDAARKAYDGLSEADKALVTNYSTLQQAEAAYQAFIQAEADKVIAKIAALPNPVTAETAKLSVYNKVVDARTAYDALKAEEKALVTNLAILEAAEAYFAALPGGIPEGALKGAFTINAGGDRILFSKGNLQYVGSWQFAAHQWDIIGAGQADDNRDLFGWGTGDAPNKVSETSADYTTYTEWGTQMGAGWYTLDYDEWKYIFKTRANAANLYAPANVNGVNGIVLLPDEWKQPDGTTFTAGVTNFGTNVYADEAWTAMENAGAVFLPVAGYRYKGNINWVGQSGFYWTSTVASAGSLSWSWLISASSVSRDYYNLYYGMSVRLVNAAGAGPIDAAQAAVDLINAIPNPVTLDEACVKAIKDAREAVTALGANASLIDETDMAKLTKAEADYTNLIKAEADKVVAKINAIPQPVTLKLATRDSIESARAAYDALNADQQALVSNYAVLTAAEATIATLNPGGGAPLPEGALTGAFSINADGDKIAFSKGNLQATTANLGETWTWAFAANQYDYVGNAVANTAITGNKTVSTNGTIDLFGWSTAATYYGINNSNVSGKHPGDFIDWGETIAEGWRTLTRDEWNYLFETRTDAASKYGHATVAGIHGIIVLPDSYKGTAINADHSDWSNNIISAEDWAVYEANGVAFLPAAGSRLTTNVNYVGEYGLYWTSTTYGEKWAYRVRFLPNLSPDYGDRVPGHSVRLVTAHTGSVTPLDSAQVVKDLIEAIPVPVTLDDACVNAVQAARDAYNALAEATKGALDDATVQKLNQAITDYTALIQAGADAVTAKIAAIPQPVTLKLATRDSIQAARAAYDALTDDQKLLVSNYQTLLDAEATMATLNPGGGMPADALNGKFTINAGGDQIAFAKGNLQATTEDLGEHWTWSFAANQWNYLGIAVANSKINGNGTVSENGTVDLFGWSTAATYYGINNSYKAVDYIGDFVDWGPNMGAGWRTLTKDEWNYLIENNTKGRATVNDKNGYIFLPNDWSGPAFTPDPDNFTTNVYSGDDWTAMENAGAVFLPSGPARNGTYALIANDAKYCSSTSLNNDTSYVFTIYYNQSQSACTGTNRAYGCMVRLVTEGGGATPLDSAQAVKDLIDAIPVPVTLDDACVNAIEAARTAYDALSEAAQGALDAATVQKLTDAEATLTALNQAVADEVIAKINNIPQPVELKLATRDSIESARAAYDALNAAQQALVTNYQTLLDAEAALAEKNKGGSASVDIVWDINTGIANVDPNTTSPAYDGITITTGNGNRFYQTTNPAMLRFFFTGGAGRYAFAKEDGSHFTKVELISSVAMSEWLLDPSRIGTDWVVSDENKKATWIGDADTVKIWDGAGATSWVDVDSIVFTVNGTATALDSAQHVKDLIDAIPTPVEYPTSGPAIAAALVAYQQLSDAAKGALDDADVQKMTDAAAQYAALDAIAAIEAIPAEIVYDPAVKAAIETAREKYDALIDASKALVDAEVVEKLTNAEQAWADLVALIEHNVSYIGKDGELKNEKVALLNIPNPAPDFNGYEFVRWDVKAGDFLEEGLRIKAVYTPIITTDPVAFDTLVYNGTAQTLIEAGVASDGHIEYRLNEGDWSAELPKADMAAAYVVDYKLVREGHEDYMAGSVTAVIAKAPVTYVAPTAVDSLVYNASNQTLIAAGQTNDGTFEYSFDPTLLDSWSADLPHAMNAGTYNVYFRVNGDMNHLDSVAATPVAVTIAKAELTATADDKNVIYGDAVPAYTVTYAGWLGDDDATVLTGDIAFACEYASTSNVGEYAITPSGVTAKNYTITFVDGKLTVSKAASSCEAPVAFDTLVYNGFAQTLIESGLPTGGEMQYSLDTTLLGSWSTELPQAKDAGAYKVFYRVKGDLNHNDQDYDQPIELSIAQAALMITAEDKSVIYGDSVPEFTAAYEGWMNSDDASVVSGLTYTCEYAPTSNVGEYAIVPSGATAMNYAISYTNGKLTVAQAALMITAEDKSVIYGDSVPEYTATYEGWKNGDDASVVSGLTYTCEYAPTSNVGEYAIVPSGAEALNYAISYTNGKLTVFKGTLTITANDTLVIYGDEAPAFTASYSGWINGDDESVVSGLAFTTPYQPGSPVGTYAIQPVNATADNYQINFVEGTLTVNKAIVSVSGAEAQEAKFADGHTGAEVLNAGTLNGIKLNDPLTHVTTAVFSSADVSEHLTITLFYELTGDAALLANYDLQPTSEVFTTEGVIIETFTPDNEGAPEDQEAKIQEGIEVYSYGYCTGTGYSLNYHLNSGYPNQYKIEFEDSRFDNVAYEETAINGRDGEIEIEIPDGMPTGDYKMTVTFRDSRFDWLESAAFEVTFHVNMPETYVKPLFGNTIVLVDTLDQFTDIQWYYRANATEIWQPVPGANGHYLHVDGKLEGEYFVAAKYDGKPTFTCGQADMETLYGADENKQAKVRAYPNPVVTTTTVSIENSENYEHNLRIVNLMGIEVENTTFEGNETVVDMDSYTTGNYTISVDGIVVKVLKK